MIKHTTIFSGARPKHYELYFEPDFSTFKFIGKAIIVMTAEEEIGSLTLNSKELEIKTAIIRSEGTEQKATIAQNDDTIILNFSKKIKGELEIRIEYEGVHNEKLYGFYRSSYVHGGGTHYLLSSQFEAPDARAAFPCIDEPEFKATFDVSLMVDNNFEAVSNMPIKEIKKFGEKKLVVFYTSPKMSTYLLYLGVGKYDSEESHVKEVKIRLMAREGNEKYLSMPLEYAGKLFADLQEYFIIKYPLPKLDLIGIPDFAAGAMENWGAMTFRETALLGTDKTSVNGKQRIAEVIAHEIVHQWFGDLVTMKWWDDMWLNESFATFMAYKSVDRVFQEWKMMLKYYPDIVGPAFVADGMENTHPISVKVNTVGEIAELFDAIGYNKGGSVLLMLENFVGSGIFRKGLVRYLEDYSYSNATKKDLWTSIEKECISHGNKQPIVSIMEDWITRKGYPIIHVDYKDGVFELEQERFTISGNKPGVWKIPINYISENGEGKILMDSKKITLKTGSWIKLNYKQTGFYRINYPTKILEILGQMILDKKLDSLDVWGLENDLFALVRTGDKPISDYVNFVKKFCINCSYPANVTISEHLGWLNTVAVGQEFVKDAKELDLFFHKNILKNLGFEVKPDESSIDKKLRALALMELGRLGDQEVLTWAKTVFDDKGKRNSLSSDLKAAVFFTNVYNYPSKEKLKELFDIYKGDATPEEKIIALRALGMFSNNELIAEALARSLLDGVRLQDALAIPGIVAGFNPHGKEHYKKWAMKNWKLFVSKYTPSSHMLRSCVSAFGMLSDKKSKAELESFFADNSNLRDDITIAVKQVFEQISANIRFIERNST